MVGERDRALERKIQEIPKTFTEKLERLQERGNFVCVGLDSDWSKIPGEFKELGREEGTFQFNRAIIDSTADLVCAYKPNIAFYEDSAEGERALERTVEYIRGKYPFVPVIGDAKRGDIGNTNEGYIRALFERYNFDAVTIYPNMGAEALKPFLDREDKGIIVVCRTSNRGAEEFQDWPVPVSAVASNKTEMLELFEITGKTEIPYYLAMAHRIARHWNGKGNVGLVVGATYPGELEEVRKVAPDMQILLPGIGAQGAEVQSTVVAGMDERTGRIIVNSARGIIFAEREEGETVGQAARREAQKLREAINFYRINPEGMTDSQKEVADVLLQEGAIKFGAFKLKMHNKNPTAPLSPIYIDLRVLRSSSPDVKLKICRAYLDLMKDLQFDLLADVPTAITPIVTLLSQITGVPMISPRGDKTYGSGAQIDGDYRTGQTALIIDDSITKGESKIGSADKLRGNGLNVKDVVVLVDREQGGTKDLIVHDLKLHSAFTISNLLRYYKRTGRIDQGLYDETMAYLAKYK